MCTYIEKQRKLIELEKYSSQLNWRKTDNQLLMNNLLNSFEAFGISRICDISHLDLSHIPVFTVVRPNGKTLAVSAGKGLSKTDSIVSGLMEAAELTVAEDCDDEPVVIPFNKIPIRNRMIISDSHLLANHKLNEDLPIGWLTAKNLLSDDDVFVPEPLIKMGVRKDRMAWYCFIGGSNGLASGLSHEDAIVSALFELIERDGINCWDEYCSKGGKPNRIELESIHFQSTTKLIEILSDSGLSINIIDRTTDIGIPVFCCYLFPSDKKTNELAAGYGCHNNPEIALNRAITEAVQGRVVRISGARDDFADINIKSIKSLNIEHILKYELDFTSKTKGLNVEKYQCCLGNYSSRNIIDLLVEELKKINIRQVLVYQFDTKSYKPQISVARVVIPGFGAFKHRGSQSPKRALEFNPIG